MRNKSTTDQQSRNTEIADGMPVGIQALWDGWHPDDRECLTEFRETMRTRYANAVTRIVLFGSRARGDWNQDSDIDVLVIVRDEGADRKDEIRRVGSRLPLESTALGSVIVRTEREWQLRRAARTRWYANVESDGILLYSRTATPGNGHETSNSTRLRRSRAQFGKQ